MSHSMFSVEKNFPVSRGGKKSQLMRHGVAEYMQILGRNPKHLGMCQEYIFKTLMPLRYVLHKSMVETCSNEIMPVKAACTPLHNGKGLLLMF